MTGGTLVARTSSRGRTRAKHALTGRPLIGRAFTGHAAVWRALAWCACVGALLGLLLPLLPSLTGAASAQVAAVDMIIAPSFPTTVSVGQTGRPAQLTITNNSTGVGPVTLSEITLNPSCGDVAVSCNDPDLGVLQLSATATGSAGSCSGTAFAIVGPDVNGRSLFVPTPPVVLQPTGPNDECFIDFTFDVLQAPTADADPDADLQTRQFATTTGSGATATQTLVGGDDGTSIMTVGLSQPSVSTQASVPVTVGSPIFDTATLSGGTNPTGTMTFQMFGPNIPTCPGVVSEGPPARITPRQVVVVPTFVSVRPVDGNGDYVSASFTPTVAGIYRWYATYSGDDNNYPTNPSCDDPLENVTVAGGPGPGVTTTTSTSTTTTRPPSATTTTSTVEPPAQARPPVVPQPFARTGPNVAGETALAVLLLVLGAHVVLGTWRRRGGFDQFSG